MNEYQQEQWDALHQILQRKGSLGSIIGPELHHAIRSYRSFRQQLERFMTRHFGRFCTRACFESRTSACCSRDGIVTFWGDLVINVGISTEDQINDLFMAIQKPLHPFKCIYLGQSGCRWQLRPLGCALFLCDAVQVDVLERNPELGRQWDQFKAIGKNYRWPDQPVLFDDLEQVFMAVGCRSPLMYINTSPGLLRIKQKAGLAKKLVPG